MPPLSHFSEAVFAYRTEQAEQEEHVRHVDHAAPIDIRFPAIFHAAESTQQQENVRHPDQVVFIEVTGAAQGRSQRRGASRPGSTATSVKAPEAGYQ